MTDEEFGAKVLSAVTDYAYASHRGGLASLGDDDEAAKLIAQKRLGATVRELLRQCVWDVMQAPIPMSGCEASAFVGDPALIGK